jgi:hypothetical protein
MGFFSKPKRDDAQDVGEILEAVTQLDRAWDDDPARVIAHFLANADDPLLVLARALVMLAAEGVVTLEGLATLGIDRVELERIVSILSTDAPAANPQYAMEVRKAIEKYDTQIDEIIKDAGIVVDDEKRNQIRSTLAAFAHENEITDLKIAYRLMRSEGSDPIKGLPGSTRPQGYL